MIRSEEDGKVHVHKTEKPTQHGAWTGVGVGALVGIMFPPAIIGSAIVGGGAGGVIGHLGRACRAAISRTSATRSTTATRRLIVIGESKIEEQIEKAIKRANKTIEKQIDADAEELKRAVEAAGTESA